MSNYASKLDIGVVERMTQGAGQRDVVKFRERAGWAIPGQVMPRSPGTKEIIWGPMTLTKS